MLIQVDDNELITLLSYIYKDAEEAIDHIWNPSKELIRFYDQQEFIREFCNANNIHLKQSQKTKYAIQVITVLCGQEISREYYIDDKTDKVIVFDNRLIATRVANKMCDEFVYTEVVEYG